MSTAKAETVYTVPLHVGEVIEVPKGSRIIFYDPNTVPGEKTVDTSKLERILAKVKAEVERAETMYPPMASFHEGHSVLKEEQEELWAEVKKSPKKRDLIKIEEEGVQTAAMAVRFLLDLVPNA